MILKSPSTTKIKKPILVGEAPFSGFYSGFYFVPLYALQHMYYGVSPRSRYSSYNLLLRKNKGVSARPRLFVKHKKDFLPLPNFYISKVFFLKRFGSWLEGKKNFFWFKPNTFFYDFFLGFFLFVIASWPLSFFRVLLCPNGRKTGPCRCRHRCYWCYSLFGLPL